MKRWFTTTMIAAAAMLVATSAASAQTLTAEIPFAFDSGIGHMQAGSYRVTVSTSGGANTVAMYNLDSRQTTLAVAQAREGNSRGADPKLVFRCVGGSCSLQDIWTGNGAAYRVPESRHSRELGAIRIVMVPLK